MQSDKQLENNGILSEQKQRSVQGNEQFDVQTNNAPNTIESQSWTKDKKILYVNTNYGESNYRQLAGKRSYVPNSPVQFQRRPIVDLIQPQPAAQVSDLNSPSKAQKHPRKNEAEHSIGPHKIDHDINDNTSSISNTAPSQASSCSNSTTIGHYELGRTLGKGNFSTVKLAQHKITQHNVAIKIVKTSILSEDNLIKVKREIDVLKKISRHKHIVKLYQVIRTNRYFMLVTEFCANGELYDYLIDQGKLSEPQSCNYFLQILSAVEYLHDRNIVHRDLKAENLLLTDNYKIVKIADFGFANYFDQNDTLCTWCGSPPYAAPELFKGLKYIGPPVDIWSLGVILYVLVCGSLPFDGHNLVFLKTRVLSGRYRVPFFMSQDCELLIKGMLRLDPRKRFSIKHIKSHDWCKKNEKQFGRLIENKKIVGKLVETSEKRTVPMDVSLTPRDQFNGQDNENGCNADQELHGSRREANEQKVLTGQNLSIVPPMNEGISSVVSQEQGVDPGGSEAEIANLVDSDIANAVSNMSLNARNFVANDTNQVINQKTDRNKLNWHDPNVRFFRIIETGGKLYRLDKGHEHSFEDKIKDFMIHYLKVAATHSEIEHSIMTNNYNDLHAMYSLLRDDPRVLLDALASANFKVPTLPLESKKPSIRRGFVHGPINEAVVHKTGFDHDCIDGDVSSIGSHPPCSSRTASGEQGNIITNQMIADQTTLQRQIRVIKLTDQRKSEDQFWIAPPQLFLTPPVENNQTTGQALMSPAKDKDSDIELNDPDITTSPSCPNPYKLVAGRHSFDSTMQSIDRSGLSSNQLSLANSPKNLWDSSILDTPGVLSTSPNINQNVAAGAGNPNEQGEGRSLFPGDRPQMNQILGEVNLPVSGHQNTPTSINPDLLLAHLNSLATSAAVTHSSLLTHSINQGEQRAQNNYPVQFMPNNLMNQNYNAMNKIVIQGCTSNNQGGQTLSLLDPNGLISGLERRASDGQASYNSLSMNIGSQQTQPANCISICDAIATTIAATNNVNTLTSLTPSSSIKPSDDINLSMSTTPEASNFIGLDKNLAAAPDDGQTIDAASTSYVVRLNSPQLGALDLTKRSKNTSETVEDFSSSDQKFLTQSNQRRPTWMTD